MNGVEYCCRASILLNRIVYILELDKMMKYFIFTDSLLIKCVNKFLHLALQKKQKTLMARNLE